MQLYAYRSLANTLRIAEYTQALVLFYSKHLVNCMLYTITFILCNNDVGNSKYMALNSEISKK
jgi:hypothetical protein